MNKKTITKYSIEISAEEAKNRIVDNFLDILKDYAAEDIEDLKTQTSLFDECIEDVKNNNWKKLFQEGFTMMILDQEAMDFVEDFFIRKNKYHLHEGIHPSELEIVVKTQNGESFIVPEKFIQY
jgi:hypothetical protein